MKESAIVRWISEGESVELVRIQYCFTSLRTMAQACSATARHDSSSKTFLRLMSRPRGRREHAASFSLNGPSRAFSPPQVEARQQQQCKGRRGGEAASDD